MSRKPKWIKALNKENQKLNEFELSGNSYTETIDIDKFNRIKLRDLSYNPDILIKLNVEYPYEYVTLSELIRAYFDCRKHKAKTHNAIKFEMDFVNNIKSLYIDLNNGTYDILRSICFIVFEPKPREIFAGNFADRTIHHLIINRLLPEFEKHIWIQDSYSCRKGKGTLYGQNRIMEQIKEISHNYTDKDLYILKLDLRACFVSTPKDLVYNFISHIITNPNYYKEFDDKQVLFNLNLFYKILYNKPQENCHFKTPKYILDKIPAHKSLLKVDPNKNQGTPVGNITSQIFENIFLSILDYYCVRCLGYNTNNGNAYGRYVDDMVFASHDKEYLLKTIRLIIRFVHRHLNMRIAKNKIYLLHYRKGFSFIGGYIRNNRKFPIKRNLYKTKYSLLQFNDNFKKLVLNNEQPSYLGIQKLIHCVNSRLGHLMHMNTYKLRKQLLKKYFDNEYCEPYISISKTYNKILINPNFNNSYKESLVA